MATPSVIFTIMVMAPSDACSCGSKASSISWRRILRSIGAIAPSIAAFCGSIMPCTTHPKDVEWISRSALSSRQTWRWAPAQRTSPLCCVGFRWKSFNVLGALSTPLASLFVSTPISTGPLGPFKISAGEPGLPSRWHHAMKPYATRISPAHSRCGIGCSRTSFYMPQGALPDNYGIKAIDAMPEGLMPQLVYPLLQVERA